MTYTAPADYKEASAASPIQITGPSPDGQGHCET
jgi:hypothetical protein